VDVATGGGVHAAGPSALARPTLASVPLVIGEPDEAPVLVKEPAVAADANEPVAVADEPAASSATPPPFKLRPALARCKTHPTARLEVEYVPGRAIKINGARPLGGVGHCVEDVLERHPPQRAMTIRL